MKSYIVKIYDNIPASIDEVGCVNIDVFNWDKAEAPQARAALVMLRDVGFVFFGEVCEKEPKAVYENYNDPVYKDSCIEFFACWRNGDARYINMEMNSRGALLSCVGENRHERVPIAEYTSGEIFKVEAYKKDKAWGVRAVITFEMLEKIYGIDRKVFCSGYEFSGNFYKCGDECEVPHYVSWNPIGVENPDFHRPEWFGKLIIG